MRIGLGIGLNRFRGGQAAGPVNTVAPEITGTAERGEELSSTTGTWTGTGTITYAYQWLRNGAEIAGATNSTYTLVAADDNANIRCRVTATDDKGSRSAFSTTLGPVLGAPLNLTAPALTGTETVGQTLSVTTGTWQGVATITFAYQWRRDGVAISGATSSTYTLVAADYDAIIDCVVTATNSIDSTTADSNDTGAIAGLAPTNDTAPSISGSTGLGDTLTRVAGSWSGTPTPSISGQWRRDGVAIAGETGATYTIALADSGAVIDYLETATNSEGTATADSNDITAQTFVSPTIGGVPTLAGTEEVGETLTATAAAATGNPAPTTSWQWQRSADGSTGWADISGATSSTYTLVAADETNYVRVKQIETNALGTDEAVSAATGQIVAGGATGILDAYTGAAFAFSPDTLIYSGFSVTDNTAGSNTNGDSGEFTLLVRRDSDNALQSFTWEEVGDGTLVTWVGAGNNGFVQVAYEQSLNDNRASQTTASNQPKIVDNGSLVVENGKAALDFDGASDFLRVWDNTTAPTEFQTAAENITFFSVEKPSRITGAGAAFLSNNCILDFRDFNGENSRFPIHLGYNNSDIHFAFSSRSILEYDEFTAPSNLNQKITTVRISVNTVTVKENNIVAVTGTATNAVGTRTVGTVNSTLAIGARSRDNASTDTAFYWGKMQCLVFFTNSDEQAALTAINNEYSIY
jgi:hypothetical protein